MEAVREVWERPFDVSRVAVQGGAGGRSPRSPRWTSSWCARPVVQARRWTRSASGVNRDRHALASRRSGGGSPCGSTPSRCSPSTRRWRRPPRREEKDCVRAVNEYRMMMGRRRRQDPRAPGARRARPQPAHAGARLLRPRRARATSATPENRTPGDRARRQGYGGGVGENIARGTWSGRDAFAAWFTSSGHHRNMVARAGRRWAPAAAAATWWTQVFGAAGGTSMDLPEALPAPEEAFAPEPEDPTGRPTEPGRRRKCPRTPPGSCRPTDGVSSGDAPPAPSGRPPAHARPPRAPIPAGRRRRGRSAARGSPGWPASASSGARRRGSGTSRRDSARRPAGPSSWPPTRMRGGPAGPGAAPPPRGRGVGARGHPGEVERFGRVDRPRRALRGRRRALRAGPRRDERAREPHRRGTAPSAGTRPRGGAGDRLPAGRPRGRGAPGRQSTSPATAGRSPTATTTCRWSRTPADARGARPPALRGGARRGGLPGGHDRARASTPRSTPPGRSRPSPARSWTACGPSSRARGALAVFTDALCMAGAGSGWGGGGGPRGAPGGLRPPPLPGRPGGGGGGGRRGSPRGGRRRPVGGRARSWPASAGSGPAGSALRRRARGRPPSSSGGRAGGGRLVLRGGRSRAAPRARRRRLPGRGAAFLAEAGTAGAPRRRVVPLPRTPPHPRRGARAGTAVVIASIRSSKGPRGLSPRGHQAVATLREAGPRPVAPRSVDGRRARPPGRSPRAGDRARGRARPGRLVLPRRA